jgi:hypothetical protein
LAPEVFYQRDVFFVVALLFVLLLAAAESGFRRANRVAASLGDAPRSQFSTLQGALFGLLALLLGFTFAMAQSRFETRQLLVVEEANAIGTTALRAELLPTPYRGVAADLIRRYVDRRLAAYDGLPQPPGARAADSQVGDLQKELWQLVQQAAEKNPSLIPTGQFITALNEMFDLQAKRDAAGNNHVPESVLVLLFMVAVLAMELVGYGCGLTRHRNQLTMISLALVISMVILTIIDLDRPLHGLIRVSEQTMIDLRHGLDQP